MRRQYTLSLSEAADFSSLASYYHHNSFCEPLCKKWKFDSSFRKGFYSGTSRCRNIVMRSLSTLYVTVGKTCRLISQDEVLGYLPLRHLVSNCPNYFTNYIA